MPNVLVLANETIGGEKLLDAIKARAKQGDEASFFVVVPQTRPRFGNVIYDDAVRDSAQVRIDLALEFMRNEGIKGAGEVGDVDPMNAAKDAIAEYGIDEIIVSTLPAESSGWLRRDLPERLREETGLPVEHVVVDLVADGLPFDVTLVLANRTAASGELVDHLKKLADESPHRFIVVVPQSSGLGHAVEEAREPAAQAAGLAARGGDRRRRDDRRPGPVHGGDERRQLLPPVRDRDLDAARGAVEVDRGQAARARRRARPTSAWTTSPPSPPRRRPSPMEAASAAVHEDAPSRPARGQPLVARGPLSAGDVPLHHQRDHGLRGLLHGLLLHPGRGGGRVAGGGDRAAEADRGRQHRDPAVLVDHDALGARVGKAGNRNGLKAGIFTTFLLGATFLFIQVNEYVHIGFSPSDSAQGSVFYGLTGLHGAHVTVGLTLLAFTTIRAFKGHFTPEDHRGVEIPGIYWHFVDVMWVVVYTTVYII